MRNKEINIVVALTVQKLVKDGYLFKKINNAIEIADPSGRVNYFTDKEFLEWIYSLKTV